MTRWNTIKHGDKEALPGSGSQPPQVHVYEQSSIDAINAAMAARRPLLVRGEPGTGKSQLAIAAAKTMNRPLLSEVIDGRTTAQDLLWKFDAVARLAEAQLAGALRSANQEAEDEIRKRLLEQRFVTPGTLWWALAWESAKGHANEFGGAIPEEPKGWESSQGTVVLIDEIDKADSDVPNGLLEVLGSGTFHPRGYDKSLCVCGKSAPLVIITTNEERALPDAFLRRCLVLHLALPKLPEKRAELIETLVERGRAHFGKLAQDSVLNEAAELLVKDRETMQQRRLSPPGQAEYLDLIRAVIEQAETPEAQSALLKRIAQYALQKHPEEGNR